MKIHFAASLALAAALTASTAPAASGHTLDASERAALVAAQSSGLRSLRAGVATNAGSLDASQRAVLRQAAANAEDLGALRAGAVGISNHDLKVVGVVLLAVLVVAVLL